MDKIAEASLLFDFYGELLTEKQRDVMRLYHDENLSLSEIGEEFGISRQAVHETLKKAEQSLKEYEAKLGLVDKFVRTDSIADQIDLKIDEIIALEHDEEILARLRQIKGLIWSMEE